MSLIGGRYKLADRIGGGGMADVFRAHDRTLDRYVAIKVMRPAFATDPEFVERFHREAEAMGAIEHPNIVRVLDYGASADGPYIVMELVAGGTLWDLMRARGRVDQYIAAQIAAAIADGLEAAHVRGVLHRDLKPDNVLLDEGRPKITDFGIARLAAATAITRTGELLGTPQYLAPEQMSGGIVDERADVYALGVILYEMLTGARPTGGRTPSEIVARRLRVDPRPPSRLVPIAPALNALVLRALARDPARRVRRAADLREALLQITPPAPRAPSPARGVRLRWPSPAPSLAPLAVIAASLRDIAADSAARVRHVASLRVASPAVRLPAMPQAPVVRIRLPSSAPVLTVLALVTTSMRDQVRVMLASKALEPATTRRIAAVRSRQRSLAGLLAALALLVAFVGGSLVFAGARPTSVAPLAVATATPVATVAALAGTSSPAVTSAPTVRPEPTAE
ncbi:MAG TPA: protein kinase, partial [Candidatus Limnocylindria bacterium]|nr:protein kinase [Candidatus Limnocylindria bacterium]